jgi:protein-disulfide isomerase
MMTRRGLGSVLAAALAAALQSACSGEGLPPSVLTTGGAATEKTAFNPFSTDPETMSGGREVIANPTIADVMLTGELPEMSFGRNDAPVTLIKYMSLTCPHCKRFQAEVFPTLKRDYIDTGRVRFILREFPIGKSSGTATVALRCAAPDKYLDLYGRYLSQQASWVSQEVRSEAIFKVAAQAGVTDAQFAACMKDQQLISRLNWVKERGRKLGIIGTPNFFLNGRLIKSTLDLAGLKAAIEAAESGRPVATKTTN